MQFTVTINQVKALEWGLNLPQANLFAFVYECPSWCRPVSKDGEVYYALSKSKVVEELPLLGSPDTVYRNLKTLAKLGVIELSYTNQITLVRLTDKGREWNRKVHNKSGSGNSWSEKSPTNNDTALIGKKSDPGRKNPRAGSEKSPTNQVTNQLTPTHSDTSDARVNRDDSGVPVDQFQRRHPMTLDWKPDHEQLSSALLHHGLPTDTPVTQSLLADFTAHYADRPGLEKSLNGWTYQLAKWIKNEQSRMRTAGGSRHENSQSSRNGRRTAAEARAAAEAGEYTPRRRRTAAEARAAAEARRSGGSGRVFEGATYGC